ncbi:MAG TPA: DUF4184 family protein [Steroidobacteraceae bacterium]
MPYTLSHVAAVLPFSRLLARLRILSAVVIGSMVPDFGYLLPIHPPRATTHSAVSLVTFSLPLGLLSYWIFQRWMKVPLLNLLSDSAYLRWRPFSAPAALSNPRQWLLAAGGVLAGAVTHLGWDAFTHEDARGMRMMPELDDWRFELHGHHLIGARLLQDGSSMLGLALTLVMLIYALRREDTPPVAARALGALQRRNWLLAYAFATLVFSAGFDALNQLDGVYWEPTGAHINAAGVALLRGLALGSLGVSLFLGRYLRAGCGKSRTSEV